MGVGDRERGNAAEDRAMDVLRLPGGLRSRNRQDTPGGLRLSLRVLATQRLSVPDLFTFQPLRSAAAGTRLVPMNCTMPLNEVRPKGLPSSSTMGMCRNPWTAIR